MTAKSGFIANGLIHVNRADPTELDCPCHGDLKAVCLRWEEWGFTRAEHEATLRDGRISQAAVDRWRAEVAR